ncbi:protein DA1-related 1-like [Rhodamnia argentea]|uniref:Protein DA1-related 1-like n=1 Tax=Rhodamnia argentea TaxID=178133 RepID=A0A8B8NC20_9MYRT|nr:protein DA1-related 1-like [Rhodamnia argentea]
MGWLKRILQGSTSKSRWRSNGSCCEVEDRRSCSDGPSDAEAIQKDESTEGEETDYQIARIRSFSEDGLAYNLYGATSTEDWVRYEELKWDDNEDERPTQSFQQSLALESSSLWNIANISQPFPYAFYPDNGHAFLHPERVYPYASHDSLTGHHEVFVSGDHSIYQNIEKDHHLNHDYWHHPRPICFVCGQPIPVDVNGRLLFRQHPFWRQKYCLSHETDGTPCCCGCERLESLNL